MMIPYIENFSMYFFCKNMKILNVQTSNWGA